MRTIKFRGLRTDGKGWEIGNLINWHQALKPRIIWYTEHGEHAQELDFEETNFEVSPESVGQFTGLHDKNGKEIYEGDLLTLDSYNFRYLKDTIWEVIYSESDTMFKFKNNKNSRETGRYGFHSFYVIGNIHENPELVK
ncbi:MAG: hypothetical protein ABS44_11710 [Chryseobacterium sp. SCN 40-13]|nr:MAG: hypothetical protein ABS44_11710 [Chryseobacterium sp. SCN 40-13]